MHNNLHLDSVDIVVVVLFFGSGVDFGFFAFDGDFSAIDFVFGAGFDFVFADNDDSDSDDEVSVDFAGVDFIVVAFTGDFFDDSVIKFLLIFY
jgi:hypothetical protein